MSILEDDKDLLRCYSHAVGSYAVGMDERGLATTWVKDYTLSVRQMVQTFGRTGHGRDIDWSLFTPGVKTAWDNGDYETQVEVTWMVCPNEEHDPRKLDAKYLPWHSAYFERGREAEGRFLRSSGYREFPLLVPRWDVTDGDSYGTSCPGMDALGDVKGLQIMHRRKAKAIDKALDPPLQGPSDLRTQKTSLLPGDITYVDDNRAQGGLRPIHETRLEGLQFMLEDIGQTQFRIRRAFFEDLFLMLASSDRTGTPVTAREIEERHEEKLLALGPMLERTNDELLDPMTDRVFAMLMRSGAIPPPPEELQTEEASELKVEYISIMSQAQKLVGVSGQDRFLQSTLQLAEAFPQVRHKIKVFQVVDEYAEMLGVNPNILRTDDEADAQLEAEQQAQAQAMEAEQLKSVAQAGKALSDTPMKGDNALQRIAQGLGAA
jgi:Bacteriophage head to tail connecting protein